MTILFFFVISTGKILDTKIVLYYSLLLPYIVVSVSGQCTPGESRLVDGTSPRDGVMEICTVDSTWGTVCDFGFYCEEASVACHQLGFQNVRKCL